VAATAAAIAAAAAAAADGTGVVHPTYGDEAEGGAAPWRGVPTGTPPPPPPPPAMPCRSPTAGVDGSSGGSGSGSCGDTAGSGGGPPPFGDADEAHMARAWRATEAAAREERRPVGMYR